MASLELIAYHLLFNNDDSDEEYSLSLVDRCRRSKKIPRIALKKYNQSAFRFMYESGNDQALLNCCAVDQRCFKNCCGSSAQSLIHMQLTQRLG